MAALMVAGTCFGEDAAPVKFYKLEFVMKQMEGAKILNSRTYSTIVSTKERSSIRVGSKVPYASEKSASAEGKPYATQIQQIDIGLGIDVTGVKEEQNRLSFNLTADISSIAPVENPVPDSPVVRQSRWSSTVLIPLKKRTLVFSGDDLDAKTETQLEVTATPYPEP
jgi:hypothetical protein